MSDSTSPLKNITAKYQEEQNRGGGQSSSGLTREAARCLMQINSNGLENGPILRTFLNNVYTSLTTTSSRSREEAEEICQIIDYSAGAGSVAFWIHRVFPNADVISLISDKDLVMGVRHERKRILQSERRWKEIQDPEEVDDENAEMEYPLLHFLSFDIPSAERIWQPTQVNLRGLDEEETDANSMPIMTTAVDSPIRRLRNCSDAIISSFAIETIPLPKFFSVVTRMLGPFSTFLLVTVMHPDLANEYRVSSQPGHYSPSREEIVAEAKKWGFVEGKYWERTAMNEDVANHPKCIHWVGHRVWFALILELPKKWKHAQHTGQSRRG